MTLTDWTMVALVATLTANVILTILRETQRYRLEVRMDRLEDALQRIETYQQTGLLIVPEGAPTASGAGPAPQDSAGPR